MVQIGIAPVKPEGVSPSDEVHDFELEASF